MSKKEEEKKEVEKELEKLSVAVQEELFSTKAKILGDRLRKRPVAVLLESPQVLKELANMPNYLKDPRVKHAYETGISKTQRNVVIFYERASEAGERLRGFFFMIVGGSIFVAAFLARKGHVINLYDLATYLSGSYLGRILAAGIGISLLSYGAKRLFQGVSIQDLKDIGNEKRKRYIQKTLK